jgi:tRNA-(ms[2]io[6]A)-hydroxylase
VAEKRRLPVLQPPKASSSDDENGEPRPPWHWVGFGTVLIFAVWLPLAYVGSALQRSMLAAKFGADATPEQIAIATAAMTASERAQLMLSQALPVVFALAAAAFAGGLVVGKFGAGAGPKESARSGAITALIAVAISFQGFSVATLVSTIVIALVATGFAWWGGRVGIRKKSASAG